MVIIVLLFIAGILLLCVIAGFQGAPWAPSRSAELAPFLEAAKLAPGITFCDIGCGDGKTLIAAAKSGATVIGVEINPLFWLIAKLRTRHLPNAHVHLGNLWSFSLQDVDVVMVFLMPRFMPRLADKFRRELKPGAQVISYVFEIPGRKPVQSSPTTYRYRY